MLKIIGLSGGIASGKNFITKIFTQFPKLNIVVFDADLIVHQLLKKSNIIQKIAKIFPSCIVAKNIDRKILGNLVFNNQHNLTQLEKILHPLVQKEKQKFLQQAKQKKQQIALFNVPLLLEKSKHYRCHIVLSIITNKKIRFTRFLQRNHQNNNIFVLQQQFENINNKQNNDFQRCLKANFILFNHFSFFLTKQKIFNIIKKIK
jgi:dephospho-CoA kinase